MPFYSELGVILRGEGNRYADYLKILIFAGYFACLLNKIIITYFIPQRLLRVLISLLFALLPWSFEWQLKLFSLNFPAELLIAVIGLCTLADIKAIKGQRLVLTLAAVAIFGLLVCVSTMPVVSLKYLIVEIAHGWVFVWIITRYWDWWPVLLRIFAGSLAIFVLYALCRHAGYHFREDQGILAPMPFFSDHNSYAAVLVATFFAFGGFCKRKWYDLAIMCLYIIGILFAGSRAASLSFVIGLMFWGAFLLSRALSVGRTTKLIILLMVLANLIACMFFLKGKLYTYVLQDVSLTERFNRYKCAWRMAQERPVLGFGAGTFQFQYLAFQQEADMTRISVREPAYERHVHMNGRGGGSHSEYLGVLAEHGWLGLLFKLMIVGVVFGSLMKEIKKTEHADFQRVPFSIFICLFTIALHGLVNNLFHDARIAALIWCSLTYQFMSSSSFLRLRGASSSS